MLLHELSCPKGGLLLSCFMLEDANPDHYTVAGVDQIVSHESWHLADNGHEAFLAQLGHLLRISHALVSPRCNVHRFSPPPKRGRDPSVPPKVNQRAQCEVLEGLAQLTRTPYRRTPSRRTSQNSYSTHSGE